MGYSYDGRGRLCCDNCGESGGVRKARCPFGWCSPAALCPDCRAKFKDRLTKETHRAQGCEEKANWSRLSDVEKVVMLGQGKYLRTSALNHDGRGVKVIFRNKDGDRQAYLMSRRTYRAVPLMVNVTPDDFRSHGPLRRAKSADIYEPR